MSRAKRRNRAGPSRLNHFDPDSTSSDSGPDRASLYILALIPVLSGIGRGWHSECIHSVGTN